DPRHSLGARGLLLLAATTGGEFHPALRTLLECSSAAYSKPDEVFCIPNRFLVLLCGCRCAQTLAVEAGLIKAADSLLAGGEHIAGTLYPALAGLRLLRRLNPMYP